MNNKYEELERRIKNLEIACEYSKSFNRKDLPIEVPVESRASIIMGAIKEAKELDAEFKGELNVNGKTISAVLEKNGEKFLSHSKIQICSFSPNTSEKIISLTLENGNKIEALLRKPNAKEMLELKEAIVIDEKFRTRWKANESFEKIFSMLDFFPRIGEMEITIDDLSLESSEKLARLGMDLASLEGVNKHFYSKLPKNLNSEELSPEIKRALEMFEYFVGREATAQEIEHFKKFWKLANKFLKTN